VKAYFGLKLAGYSADHPVLQRARKKILELGGVTEVNTFTKIYLCFFGQYDYDAVPAIPPEIVLFPNWFWFNIYEISSWSRAILVPAFHLLCQEAIQEDSPRDGRRRIIRRRHAESPACTCAGRKSWSPGAISSSVLDRMTHWFERVHIRPLRSIALKVAEKWVLERFEMSDGLGAIYPSMMNAIIALRCQGYSLDDPQVIRALDEFEKLGIEEGDTFRMQPCMSPVWDTAYAMFALGEAGVPANDPRMVKCADWILQKQVRNPGDWQVKNKKGKPGGWYFEFNNEFYPDVDDSAMVCLALSRVEHPNGRYQRESVQRAIDWILSMQCKNGGWASFDKDNDRMVFQYVPFADHNAMLDPPTVDITGRILEMMATYGYDKPSRREAGDSIHSQGTGARRQLVRTLGRELYLRHRSGAARPGSHRHGQPRTVRPAGSRVAPHGTESGWRLGRDRRIL
jgi:squalene-hopene/tetraprenyl-beta-curcumene cyclase